MDALFTLIGLGLAALGVWGTISFWTDGKYKRNRPDQTLSGFRSDDDTEGER
ncbi:hypothetical protein ACQPXH_27705 [Nocardia sp. CA-135953]|uniref:hypothetical protein n=1 Tax=Nocardia sp. CA-135953 TaxID=3239978 RepID=UPI003D991E1F